MRLGIQQRVLPHFRAPLYDAIAEKNLGGVEKDEGLVEAESLQFAEWRRTSNLSIGWAGHRYFWQIGLAKWIENYRPEVLAVESNPRLLSNYVGLKRARKMLIPIVGWGIGVLGDASDTGIYGSFMRAYFTQFDAMIAYSEKGAEDYRQLGVDSDKVFVAPNSVSNEEAGKLYGENDRGRSSIEEYRKALSLQDLPTVLFVGRLIPEKNVDLLLRAVERLKQPFELVIVGAGPVSQDLKGLAAELGLNPKFLGHKTGRDLALSIAIADICVLPSRGGLAVQQVMAFGKPIIVGKADGTQWDLVEEGVTGYHLHSEQPELLTSLLEKSLSDLDLLSKMGEAARDFIATKHNMDLTVDIVLSSLERIRKA